jgi:hypothetical protein
MPGKIFLSTAYLPPLEYFARIKDAEEVFIEGEENYLKQSYRNRCYILCANGPQNLTVPVYRGSIHKTPVRDIRIDYSKRWQQVHIGAFVSAYNSSAYFLYYFEVIEKIILTNHNFLLDLNMELAMAIIKILKMDIQLLYTTDFMSVDGLKGDFRYTISPKKNSTYRSREYFQVFNSVYGFVHGLSIVDLIFNIGPGAAGYL